MHNPTGPDEHGVHALGKGVGPIVAGPTARGETPTSSSVLDEFNLFLADIDDLIKDISTLTGDELDQARRKLNARIASAKASAEAVSEGITQRARHAAVVTDGYLHENPWTALAAGAAIAFLLGRVTSRHS